MRALVESPSIACPSTKRAMDEDSCTQKTSVQPKDISMEEGFISGTNKKNKRKDQRLHLEQAPAGVMRPGDRLPLSTPSRVLSFAKTANSSQFHTIIYFHSRRLAHRARNEEDSKGAPAGNHCNPDHKQATESQGYSNSIPHALQHASHHGSPAGRQFEALPLQEKGREDLHKKCRDHIQGHNCVGEPRPWNV